MRIKDSCDRKLSKVFLKAFHISIYKLKTKYVENAGLICYVISTTRSRGILFAFSLKVFAIERRAYFFR